MQMPNSFYIVFLCLSSSLFGCNDLNENIFFSSETKTIQLEYRQIFQESPKDNVSGEIFIERPKKFKISNLKLVTKISLKKAEYEFDNTILKKYIPDFEKKIIFSNQTININYKKNIFPIKRSHI